MFKLNDKYEYWFYIVTQVQESQLQSEAGLLCSVALDHDHKFGSRNSLRSKSIETFEDSFKTSIYQGDRRRFDCDRKFV